MKTSTHPRFRHARLIRLVAASALIWAAPCAHSAAEPPAEWQAWADWVEKQFPITDEHGHGPDIGGDEWMGALGRRLGVIDAEGHGPDPGSDEWRQAVVHRLAAVQPAKPAAEAEPEPQAGEKRELLSAHQTEATFDGLRQHICRGLTALCPDDCGHSGRMAVFTITKYLRHEKPGEFGDGEQSSFQVLVDDNHGNPKLPAATRDAILALKPGVAVRLDWNHDYVTRDGSSFPERVITRVAPLEASP